MRRQLLAAIAVLFAIALCAPIVLAQSRPAPAPAPAQAELTADDGEEDGSGEGVQERSVDPRGTAPVVGTPQSQPEASGGDEEDVNDSSDWLNGSGGN